MQEPSAISSRGGAEAAAAASSPVHIKSLADRLAEAEAEEAAAEAGGGEPLGLTGGGTRTGGESSGRAAGGGLSGVAAVPAEQLGEGGGASLSAFPGQLAVAVRAPNHCVAIGLALALRAAGMFDAADLVEARAQEILAARNQFAAAQHLLRDSGLVGACRVVAAPNAFDNLSLPTLVQLNDSHDSNAHCVGAFGGHLYDMNHGRLPFSRENLDKCCVGRNVKFRHVSRAVRFEPPQGKTKKKRRRGGGPARAEGGDG